MKAHLCDECARFEPNRDGVCLLGHRPYFYQPTERTVMNQQWGYKRRCQDYLPMDPTVSEYRWVSRQAQQEVA